MPLVPKISKQQNLKEVKVFSGGNPVRDLELKSIIQFLKFRFFRKIKMKTHKIKRKLLDTYTKSNLNKWTHLMISFIQ